MTFEDPYIVIEQTGRVMHKAERTAADSKRPLHAMPDQVSGRSLSHGHHPPKRNYTPPTELESLL
jgi:hypothetical protein